MIISFANAKGGTGKTTFATLFAAQKVLKGKNVVLVDLDYQCNINIVFGKEYSFYQDNSLLSVITDLKKPSEIIDQTINEQYLHLKNEKLISGNLNIIYAEPNLAEYETLLADAKFDYKKLSKFIKSLDELYDYVVIDTPPLIQNLTKIALSLSDAIIIPFAVSRLSEQGINHILEIIDNNKYLSLNTKQKIFIVQNGSNPKFLFDSMIRELIFNNIKNKENVKLINKHLPNSSLIYKSFDLDHLPILFSQSKSKPVLKIKNSIMDLFKEINI